MYRSDVMKKILESIKELVTEINFDISIDGISLKVKDLNYFIFNFFAYVIFYFLKGMDNSQVSFVSLFLRSTGFLSYRCDHNMIIGVDLQAMVKIFNCAANDDIVLMTIEDNSDAFKFRFENQSTKRRRRRGKMGD